MYYLFLTKNMMPGDYYRLPAGDKVMIRAFFEQDMEDRKRQR